MKSAIPSRGGEKLKSIESKKVKRVFDSLHNYAKYGNAEIFRGVFQKRAQPFIFGESAPRSGCGTGQV
jgi:hypothetical protein